MTHPTPQLPRRGLLATGAATLAGADLSASPAQGAPRTSSPTARPAPLVLAHRGASGLTPEHTLRSYELALQLGADFHVEADLVPTRDGVLVARHECEISGTTDVASRAEFAGRKTTRKIDGTAHTGWFTQDFTLAELKTLRAVERVPEYRQHNTIYNGLYEIPTLQEILAFARHARRRYRRPVRIALETKNPTYFRSLGLATEPVLIRQLKSSGFDVADHSVNVASFEPTSLHMLRKSLKVDLMQNISKGTPYDTVAKGHGPTFEDLLTREGLKRLARTADWVSAYKERIIPVTSGGTLGEPTSLVRDVHRAGLKLSAWTFRNQNAYLPPALRSGSDLADSGDAVAEYRAFYDAGVDGVWSDNPDTALVAREV